MLVDDKIVIVSEPVADVLETLLRLPWWADRPQRWTPTHRQAWELLSSWGWVRMVPDGEDPLTPIARRQLGDRRFVNAGDRFVVTLPAQPPKRRRTRTRATTLEINRMRHAASQVPRANRPPAGDDPTPSTRSTR